GLMLAVLRQTVRADRMLRTGQWGKWSLRLECFELYGKTVGLVGCGAIGREVARRLAPFGVRLLYAERYRLDPELERELGLSYVDLPTLLSMADVVSLHVPLLEENRHLIDAQALSQMKPTAVLINTSRGGVVDEQALVTALERRAIAGAGLDVFAQEPLPPDHPLLRLDNVVLAPHLGGATVDTFRRTVRKALENIRRFDAGLDPFPEDILIPRPERRIHGADRDSRSAG
ncbi:MAG TPA: NAD(P)-dependent oxidoreductase, partial [Bacillota bacterium]